MSWWNFTATRELRSAHARGTRRTDGALELNPQCHSRWPGGASEEAAPRSAKPRSGPLRASQNFWKTDLGIGSVLVWFGIVSFYYHPLILIGTFLSLTSPRKVSSSTFSYEIKRISLRLPRARLHRNQPQCCHRVFPYSCS